MFWELRRKILKEQKKLKKRESIYYKDPKYAKTNVINNWKHLLKFFPNSTLSKTLIQIIQR